MRDPDSWLGVEVRHLAALDAIARERSFSRAARTLGYTQSAISQQVALLERIVGARLVERSSGPRPVSLTPAGDLMVRHGRRVVDQLAAARADLAAWSAGSAGELRVGTYHSVGAKILPRVVGRLSAALPDVNVALVETPDEGQLLRLVERGELDLSFMLYPLADGPFVAVELLRDPFLLLVAEGSPLGADGRRPTMADVAALDLIAYDRVRDVTRPETHLRGTPRVVFRSNDDETIHGLVAAGMGAALLPRLSVDPGHPGVRAVELDIGLPPRLIGLAWHRDRDLLPAAREFVATTERVCAELAGEQPARCTPLGRRRRRAAAPRRRRSSAAQRAVRVDLVGAHAPQRRRVGVDRDGEGGVVLAHAVHVGGVEVEGVAGAAGQPARRSADHQALLDDLALHDGDGAAGQVVVVEAGVVAAGPGDDPDVEVVVAPELLEVPGSEVSAHTSGRQDVGSAAIRATSSRSSPTSRSRPLGVPPGIAVIAGPSVRGVPVQ